MKTNRIFLIVLDSAGIGALPDAAEYGDAGSNTFRTLAHSGRLHVPNMAELGLFHIDGVDFGERPPVVKGAYGKLAEQSKGKDTTIGHWEIGGVVSHRPLPTYPQGFPPDLLEEFSARTGRGWLCNKPYSGTQVLTDYGRQQKETGNWIVYTSADSVFQLAAHEQWIGLEELYKACEIARELCSSEHGVGRIIARPFVGEDPDFTRTANRHDYSIAPPADTMLDLLSAAGLDVIGIGKIGDIFAGRGLTDSRRTGGNDDGMDKTAALLDQPFRGLAFTNLVDFDMLYGHRNNVAGYTDAMNAFDAWLGGFLPRMEQGDLLMVTADHGCDPGTPSTDHSREYVPFLAYHPGMAAGVNLGTRDSFADIASTVLSAFGIDPAVDGTGFYNLLAN